MNLLREKEEGLSPSVFDPVFDPVKNTKNTKNTQEEPASTFGKQAPSPSKEGGRVSGVNLSRKRLANISLSCPERSVILGGLLGDGSLKIYPGYKNARFSFRHSEKQSAYFFYKVALLSGIESPGSVQRQAADGWSSLGKIRYQSRALPALSEIHCVTHKNNKLQVRRKWLNHLTAHSLAIWWFDDGSIIGGGRRGVLCTDGFSEAECLVLAKYLLVVWKIRARVGKVSKRPSKGSDLSQKGSDLSQVVDDVFYDVKNTSPKNEPCFLQRKKHSTPLNVSGPLHKHKAEERVENKEEGCYYRLWLSTEQLKSFLRVVLPYVPCKEMFYKVLLTYKDLQLQERWISEVERGCPQDLKPLLSSSLEEMKKRLRK